MRDTQELRTGQIVRFTDQDGNDYDAEVLHVKGNEVQIKYRPAWYAISWVKPEQVSIPR